MRILAVADARHPALYNHFDRQRWQGVELVLGCGDLDGAYLDFIATSLGVPLFYIRGNHDRDMHGDNAPSGENLGFRVVTYKGLRIAGFEGCAWYGGRGVEYSQLEMRWHVMRMIPFMFLRGGVDLAISHAPPALAREKALRVESSSLVVEASGQVACSFNTPQQVLDDPAHRGFTAYAELLDLVSPRVWLHGHSHLNYGRLPRLWQYRDTLVANAFEYVLIDI